MKLEKLEVRGRIKTSICNLQVVPFLSPYWSWLLLVWQGVHIRYLKRHIYKTKSFLLQCEHIQRHAQPYPIFYISCSLFDSTFPQAVIQNPFSNGGSPGGETVGGETRFAYFPAATVSDGTATAVSVQATADPTIAQAGGEKTAIKWPVVLQNEGQGRIHYVLYVNILLFAKSITFRIRITLLPSKFSHTRNFLVFLVVLVSELNIEKTFTININWEILFRKYNI